MKNPWREKFIEKLVIIAFGETGVLTHPRSRGGGINTLALAVVLRLLGGRRRGGSNTLALVVVAVAVINEQGVLSAKLGESGVGALSSYTLTYI